MIGTRRRRSQRQWRIWRKQLPASALRSSQERCTKCSSRRSLSNSSATHGGLYRRFQRDLRGRLGRRRTWSNDVALNQAPPTEAPDAEAPDAEAASAAEAMLTRFVDSWNAADGLAYGEGYWDDAELVGPSGSI